MMKNNADRTPIHVIRLTTRIIPDPHGGGPAKGAFFLSKHSCNERVHITNIACNPHGVKKRGNRKVNPFFTIRYLPVIAPPPKSNSVIDQVLFLLNYTLHATLQVLSITRKKKVSIIHAHSPSVTGVVSVLLRTLAGIPFFYTYHGLDTKTYLENIIHVHLVNKMATRVFCISRRIRNALLPTFTDKGKIATMKNGIEVPDEPYHARTLAQKGEFLRKINLGGITREDKIIVYVGHMIFKQKVQGMVDFLHAFEVFMEKCKDEKVKLVFIGDGPYKWFLEQAVELSPQKHLILLPGARGDVKDFFAIADISALTSYVEGFPNVVLESMASGVPVIGTRVGEVQEIIGNTGFVLEPGDIDGMGLALSKYFEDETLQEQLRLAAFNRVKELFDWRKIGKEMRNLYLEVAVEEKSRH